MAGDKSLIRRDILTKRDALPALLRQQYDQQILARMLTMPLVRQAHSILAYMNFSSEFAAVNFCHQILSLGKRLILPRVNKAHKTLMLFQVESLESDLEIGSYGIFEPKLASCIQINSLNEVELAVLPGVAFTRQGARLGYGGGFYDKLLATVDHPPTLIAPAFSCQLVADLPEESTDQRVNWLITEQEVIDCSKN